MPTIVRRVGAIVCAVAIVASPGRAQGVMTPLVTDRPGNGENPFVLARGLRQLEIAAVGYTHIAEGSSAEMLDAGALKVRVGLADAVEGQFLFNGYLWNHPVPGPWSRSFAGYGGRVKLRLRDNAAGGIALGVIPAVVVAEDGAGRWHTTWGVTATGAATLTGGWSVGATGAFAAAPTVSSALFAASAAHAVRGPVSAMLEATLLRADLGRATTEARLGGALTALLAPTLQLDAGIDAGLTRGATAYRTYIGVARRF